MLEVDFLLMSEKNIGVAHRSTIASVRVICDMPFVDGNNVSHPLWALGFGQGR